MKTLSFKEAMLVGAAGDGLPFKCICDDCYMLCNENGIYVQSFELVFPQLGSSSHLLLDMNEYQQMAYCNNTFIGEPQCYCCGYNPNTKAYDKQCIPSRIHLMLTADNLIKVIRGIATVVMILDMAFNH